MDLDQLAFKYQTDKGSQPTKRLTGKNYTKYYAQIFAPIRNEKLTILEIGVYKGGSLKMWKEYFPKANIYGIDVDKDCVKYNTDRIKVFIGNQSDVPFLNQVVREIRPINIIIDDGAHRTRYQMTSFDTLFPHLVSGGMYIIEDIHALRSMPRYSDYNDTIERFQHRVTTLVSSKVEDIDNIDSIRFIRPATTGAMIIVTRR